jgi:hypothetical protein
LSFSFKPEKERGKWYTKCCRHSSNVVEAQIALAALDRSHKGPVDATLVSETFLRITLFGPQFSDSLPQSPQEPILKLFFHSNEFRALMSLRLQCLHRPCLRSMLKAIDADSSLESERRPQ